MTESLCIFGHRFILAYEAYVCFFFLAKSLYVVFGCTLSTNKMILIITRTIALVTRHMATIGKGTHDLVLATIYNVCAVCVCLYVTYK